MSSSQLSRTPLQYSWLIMVSAACAVTAIRVLYLYHYPYALYVDEAQYWTWAQGLDWGYYSKPPMVAWAIAATTSLCGDGVACVKLASPLALMGASLFIYAIGMRLYDARIAFWSALSFLLLPGITLSASLISTDPLLLFFWAWALHCVLQALEKETLASWLWVGLVCGLGLLTKYNFLFFGASLVLLLAWRGEFLALLRAKNIWAGGAITLLVFLPNLLWNRQHHFISAQHTAEISRLGEDQWFHLDNLGDFLAAQAGILGPVLFLALLVMLWRMRFSWRDDRHQFLLAFMLPILGFMIVLSFLSKAHGNWAAPAYVTGIILITAWLIERNKRWVIVTACILHVALAGAFMRFDAVAEYFDVKLTEKNDPFRRIRGWQALGPAMQELMQRYPDALILTDHRKLSAEILYYTHPQQPALVEWNADGHSDSHYQLTTSLQSREGESMLYITEYGAAQPLLSRFGQSEPLSAIQLPLTGGESRSLAVYYLQGFKGYE